MSLTIIELQALTDKITSLLQCYASTLEKINKEGKEYLSEPQRRYLTNLIANKVNNLSKRSDMLSNMNRLTKLEASQLIYKLNHNEHETVDSQKSNNNVKLRY